jgi:hypothetical protein
MIKRLERLKYTVSKYMYIFNTCIQVEEDYFEQK